MTNSASSFQREIKITEQKLITKQASNISEQFFSDNGSSSELLSRIAQATPFLTKLKPIIWRGNNISVGSKVKLMRSLVISIFLYARKSWTLTAE